MSYVTIIQDTIAESGITIRKGSLLPYYGHIPGGMICVIFNGKKEIIHPNSTKELT